MMMNEIKNATGSVNTWSRFLEMLRKADSRPARNGLEFYSRRAMPALLAMQSSLKTEQL